MLLSLGADLPGQVLRTLDGDAIEVLHNGNAEPIHLNWIDYLWQESQYKGTPFQVL